MRSRDLQHDQCGIAAVEFALILPIMLLLFLGSFETTNLVLAYMKLEASAETAADLVAQTRVNTVLQSTDFTNITNAAKQVLSPLPTSGSELTIAFASVTYNTGSAVIDWHTEVNSATPITTANIEQCQSRKSWQSSKRLNGQRNHRDTDIQLQLAVHLRAELVLHVDRVGLQPSPLHELCADLLEHRQRMPVGARGMIKKKRGML